MRMEQLKYLVDIAETKSMSKTAERMFVSPQAVSQSIKQLSDSHLLYFSHCQCGAARYYRQICLCQYQYHSPYLHGRQCGGCI